MPDNSNGNGKTLQRWHVYTALLGILLACGSIVFKAGFSDAQMNQRIDAMEKHVDYDDSVFARTDVVNAEMQSVEQTMHTIEGMEQEHSKMLEDLVLRR